MTWPAGLQSLTFGEYFNQSLDNVTWPADLQSLTFVLISAEKLNVVWPEGLRTLCFLNSEIPEEDPANSDSRVSSEVLLWAGWPRALRKLVFDGLALMC